MLFRLRSENLNSAAEGPPAPRPAAPASRRAPKPRLDDLSPEEWRVVAMMLADHRRFGEVLAQGRGPAAEHLDRHASTAGQRP